ncbi:MAG: AAA family ATPase, partial [Candidatus Latescibacteria bacterium]|nr:AAA family ATPase [Candidatus Latescibacterota bacterium]
ISRSVDVRIIAATNRDLGKDVEEGNFRQDLFYRLNVIPISIPPLRKRREDILPLANHFVEKFSPAMGKNNIRIAPGAVELLVLFNWPGNVRELENIIERAMAMSGKSTLLREEHFPQLQSFASGSGGPEEKGSLKQRTKTYEKKIIEDTLAETGGKVTRAAELLDISRQHLHNKINEYKIEY